MLLLSSIVLKELELLILLLLSSKQDSLMLKIILLVGTSGVNTSHCPFKIDLLIINIILIIIYLLFIYIYSFLIIFITIIIYYHKMELDLDLKNIDGNGFKTSLYYMLWLKDNILQINNKFYIPDTILFKFDNPIEWFFSTKDGVIKKKSKNKLDLKEILSNFIKKKNKSGIIATFM